MDSVGMLLMPVITDSWRLSPKFSLTLRSKYRMADILRQLLALTCPLAAGQECPHVRPLYLRDGSRADYRSKPNDGSCPIRPFATIIVNDLVWSTPAGSTRGHRRIWS